MNDPKRFGQDSPGSDTRAGPGLSPEPGEPVSSHQPMPKPADEHHDDGPRQVIEQAARDIERGLKDTSRGVPDDVPGATVDTRQTPGTDVPPDGVGAGRFSERQKKHRH